jgi:hypothetical protein
MLRFVYIIGFVFCFFGLDAQTKKDSIAKSEFSIYKYKPTPKDRVIFELAHTGWLGAPSGLEAAYTSGGVNILLYFDHPLGNSYFSFAWGAGFSSYNVHGPINMVYHTDTLTKNFSYTSLEKRDESYFINRIGLKVVEVPVEFRFRSRTDYQFKLSLGFKVGYVVQSFRKIFDDHENVKIFNIKGINMLRYGPTLRVGWEQLHITAFYSLSEFFADGQGPSGIHPFYIGLAYTPRISVGGK